MKDLNDNVFSKLVAELEWQKIDSHSQEAFESEQQLTLKPISIRLDPEVLQTADNIANYLGLSRQKFMAELIDGGIRLAADSIAQTRFNAASKEGFTDSEKADLEKQIRDQLTKEFF